jgi:hypothetical protein
LALVQLVDLPDLSHAEQAGSFPSHLIFADRQRAHAATGLETLNEGFKSASTDSGFVMVEGVSNHFPAVDFAMLRTAHGRR